MTPSDPLDSRSLTALTELLRGSARRPSATELDRGLHGLRTLVATGESRGHSTLPRILAVATVLCLVLGVGSFLFFRNASHAAPEVVRVEWIEGGKILDGGYLSESGQAGIKLFFNEGSRFTLMPGTRGRVRSLTTHGASLAIEHGEASIQITPGPERRWSVEAGPFMVTVTGTDFSVSWDPASERFELRLRHGRVTVSGPVVGQDLGLRPGQRLNVSLPRAETVITEERPEQAAALGSAPGAGSALAPPKTPGSELTLPVAPVAQPSATAAAVGTERRWKVALAKGQWDSILADVERDGVDTILQTATSDDLFALADAARYRRRADLARLALVTHRRRFPGSPRSLDALFLLGRVDELGANGRARAIASYEEYLTLAPAGTYAAEALGRKMILSSEVGGPASARHLADEYLRRFPEGSHARAARAIQRAP